MSLFLLLCTRIYCKFILDESAAHNLHPVPVFSAIVYRSSKSPTSDLDKTKCVFTRFSSMSQHIFNRDTIMVTNSSANCITVTRIHRGDCLSVLNKGTGSFYRSSFDNTTFLPCATFLMWGSFYLIHWKMKVVQRKKKLKLFWSDRLKYTAHRVQGIDHLHRSSFSFPHSTPGVCTASSTFSECQTQFWHLEEHKPITMLLTYLNLIMGHLSVLIWYVIFFSSCLVARLAWWKQSTV